MKKTRLVFVVLVFLILSVSNSGYGWQGRMAGMENPYGLVRDESDFLIHPAAIAGQKGINFYGNYLFNYTKVRDRDFKLNYSFPGFSARYPFKSSGDERSHEALLGASVPVGPGTMGVFLEYQGRRGDTSGTENISGTLGTSVDTFKIKNASDAYSFRALYGLPVMGMDVGFDLGLGYKNEMNKQTEGPLYIENYIWGLNVPDRSVRVFMTPYDSNYLELSWKLGAGKKFDLFDVNATVRGGNILSGDNRYHYVYGSNAYNTTMDGDVRGYSLGFDLWTRAKAGEGLTLPFLLSVDYGSKKRDGQSPGTGTTDLGLLYMYRHKEKDFNFRFGGGLEKRLGGGALVAAGLYYNYINTNHNVWFDRSDGSRIDDIAFPTRRENQFMLRLLGEKTFSPLLTLRAGLNVFYGFVREGYSHNDEGSIAPPTNFTVDGSRWGVRASMGGTIKIQRLSVEPFFAGGYQSMNLDGGGGGLYSTTTIIDASHLKRDWSIGGGFSIKLN